ncbi:IucA/IucC family protein [Paracoccus sp. NBH48]|uniref:IucA/IucC family protein n=1 Tax=Paracoccus sp. NBH48 TaxID=2596918 RepID=UPI00351C90D3
MEASLIEGHPYHPGFKTRAGFSDATMRLRPRRRQDHRAGLAVGRPAIVTRAGTDPRRAGRRRGPSRSIVAVAVPAT